VLGRIQAKEAATTGEIMPFCLAEGIRIPRESLTTRMSLLVKKGLLVRIARGLFKVAPKATEAPRAPSTRRPSPWTGGDGGVVSQNWIRVLLHIYAKGRATTQDIMTFCTAERIDLSRSAVTTGTHVYVKKGLLVRVARGVFQLEPKGAAIVEKVKFGDGRKESGGTAR
jgi:predicted transcriptional regulator